MSWFWGSSKTAPSSSEEEERSKGLLPSRNFKWSSPTLAVRRRATDGGAFSSTLCPPGPELENSCELPFGFVWTPLAESAPASDAESTSIPSIRCPSSTLPPVLCLTCLTYINPYCELDRKKGIWNCALCGAPNVLPKKYFKEESSLLSKAFTEHQVEYHQNLPLPPKYEETDSCTLIVVVDANIDPSEAKGIYAALQEQVLPNLLLEDSATKKKKKASKKSTDDDDETEDADEDEDDDSSKRYPKLQLGLIIFDEAVSMYQLGISGVASADMYLPVEDGSEEDEAILLARKRQLETKAYLQNITINEKTNSVKEDLESFAQCLSAVFGVSMDGGNSSRSSKDTAKPSRKDELKKRKEDRMRQEELAAQKGGAKKKAQISKESPWVQLRNTTKESRSQRRCTGEALQCAIDMASIGEAPSRTSRILVFTNGCPNAGEGSVVAEPSETGTKSTPKKGVKGIKAKKGKGKSGAGKKKAVVDGSQMSKAIEYFEMTGGLAMETGIAIDVFCTGSLELGLPAYQALVEPSGGYVLPHSNFTGPHLSHNLLYLLKHTYVSRTLCELPTPTPAEEEPKPKILGRLFGRRKKGDDAGSDEGMSECIIDIRCDSFVSPTHLVGPAELMDAADSTRVWKNEKGAFTEGLKLANAKELATKNLPTQEALDLSMTRVRLPRVDPLATMGVMVQINDTMDPEEDEYAFFQLTSRFLDISGRTMITRVSTHRLKVASTVKEYVEKIDDEVVSVLLAKSAVYRSLHGRDETEDTKDKVVAGDADTLEKLAYEAQLDLDATIQRISGAFRLLGLEEQTKSIGSKKKKKKAGKKSSSSLEIAFPPELKEGVRRLYHLRRGALISPGPMRSMDDRAGMRHLFLRFPLEDCLGMMAPQLWSSGLIDDKVKASSVKIQLFPAETLALWNNSIIAADQHDVQFVWSGKGCPKKDSYEEVRRAFGKFLRTDAKDRFPMPEIHMLFDGDSMSRRFTTRLAPSHADKADQQLANFPELSDLPEGALEKLRERFNFYDSASDASFHKWFWSVASATNASREDGMSLCE